MEGKEIITSFFNEKKLIQNQLDSYNYFIEKRLKDILLSFDKNSVPDYLLEIYNEINLKITDVRIGEPEYIEADGSRVVLTPKMARIRNLSYSAPLYITLNTLIGSQKDEFEIQIAKIPIMMKSNYCILKNKTEDELIGLGEDPFEPGGYFIINGTEKVVVMIEDLALNNFFVESSSFEDGYGIVYSERGNYKSLQEIKKLKDGSFIYNFGNFKDIPIFLLIRALGITKDKDIIEQTKISEPDIIFQMSEYSKLQNEEELVEEISRFFTTIGSYKEKKQRTFFYLDNFVLPHIGQTKEDRIKKAKLICKMFYKLYQTISKKVDMEDKDHYGNKRLKLVGVLLEQLFLTNFNELIVDILTSFQRTIKRGKFSSMKIIIKEQLLTQKINSALALGVWSDGRKGVAQYLKKENYFDFMSHLTRVISPLSSSQENFKVRELHSTQFGRLCPIETPEGSSIGLRKNLALLSNVTHKFTDEKKLISQLKEIGLEEN